MPGSPGSPVSPFCPAGPWGPSGPCIPGNPMTPCNPGRPLSPFCPFTPWQSHFPHPEPAQPPFAAARLLSWSRRAAGSSSSQTPSRGPMVARPRRRGRRGTAAAAHSRRAGTRARRTVRGAAARGGDLSAAPRAPQFVGGSPSPGPPRRAAPQRGGPCGAGKRRRERAAGGLWPPRAGTQGSALRTQRRPSRRSRSPTQRSSEGGHAGPRPARKAREGGRAAGPPATLVESGCARATAPEARPSLGGTDRSPEGPDWEHGPRPAGGVGPCPATVAAAGDRDGGAPGAERPGGGEEVRRALWRQRLQRGLPVLPRERRPGPARASGPPRIHRAPRVTRIPRTAGPQR